MSVCWRELFSRKFNRFVVEPWPVSVAAVIAGQSHILVRADVNMSFPNLPRELLCVHCVAVRGKLETLMTLASASYFQTDLDLNNSRKSEVTPRTLSSSSVVFASPGGEMPTLL